MQVKLSTQKQVVIRMPLQDKNGDPLQATLSQQEFVKISEPLFQRLQLPINACCWQVCSSDMNEDIHDTVLDPHPRFLILGAETGLK